MNTVTDCRLIELPTKSDPRGSLSFIESGKQIPFVTQRLFHLHGLPSGSERGGHAHRECHQCLIAMSGEFTITLDDGESKVSFTLDTPSKALHVVPGIWVDLKSLTDSGVLAVLASHGYDEADYLRQYDGFLSFKKSR